MMRIAIDFPNWTPMILRSIAIYITLLLLSGCSVSDLPFVYQQEFQEGTVLEAEDVERLEVGMSRQQVRFLIGSPDIVSPFGNQRWYYRYRFRPSSKSNREPEKRRLTVFFDGEQVVGARGDFIEPDSELHVGAEAAEARAEES
jgi:outer membrane protein assembly factor BamE